MVNVLLRRHDSNFWCGDAKIKDKSTRYNREAGVANAARYERGSIIAPC